MNRKRKYQKTQSAIFTCLVLPFTAEACSAPPDELYQFCRETPKNFGTLENYTEAWLRNIFESEAFKSYLSMPPDTTDLTDLKSIPQELASIPQVRLTCFAMVESFSANPNWRRVWKIAFTHPNLKTGISVLNFMERGGHTTWSGANLARTDPQQVSLGFAACLFAHIQDEQSISSRYYPWNWIGDARFHHQNHYLHCGNFLARVNKPDMRSEWGRLARFSSNLLLKTIAQEILTRTPSGSHEREFSTYVQNIRKYRIKMGDFVLGNIPIPGN